MRFRLFALAALIVPLAGCNDVLSSDDGKTGFVALTTYDNGGGGYALSPLGAFYGRSDLAFVPPILENCQITRYSAVGTLPFGSSLDAGERLITTLPTRVDTMLPNMDFGFLTYKVAALGGVPHTPGDTISVTVPGGPGFPAASGRVKTAEAFTHGAVDVPASGDPLALTWTPATSPGSIMAVSLRYATANSPAAALDEQIFCAFNDDGDGLVQSFLLAGWQNPDPGVREVVFSRIRVQEVQVRSDVRFTLTSTFDVPTPQLNP